MIKDDPANPYHPSIGAALRETARSFADDVFLISDDARLSFADVDKAADQLASGLLSIGIKRGDKVACWLTNTPEWVITWMACVRIGATTVSLNTRYKLSEVEFILCQSNAKALVAMDRYWNIDYLGMINELVPEISACEPGTIDCAALPELESVILWRDCAEPGTFNMRELMNAPIDRERLARAEQAVETDDPVVIIYTSGTTGAPKGATHSHRVLRHARPIAQSLHMARGDRVLGHMPLYHVAGSVATTIPALCAGCAIVLMPQWEPRAALELIVTERIAVMGGIPTHFIDLLSQPDVAELDTSCLKSAWIGGAPVTPRVAREALDVLQFDALQAVYGMTETMGVTWLAPFDAPIEITCENKGLPVGDYEVKVADPQTGAELPPNVDGEIWVRGYIVMPGYYENPEATRTAIDADGWFKTGDLGRRDDAGYFQVTGRSKEMFIVGGSNAYPAEVERFLETLPEINQAMVCGVPDARLGEVGFAFIEPSPGTEVTVEQVLAACTGNIADYKIPRYVQILGDFPRTTTNKIQRFILQDRARESIGPSDGVC